MKKSHYNKNMNIKKNNFYKKLKKKQKTGKKVKLMKIIQNKFCIPFLMIKSYFKNNKLLFKKK